MKKVKKIARAIGCFWPLLLFPLLFYPYGFFNERYLVEWLGCGCTRGFNANHFTGLFWFTMVCVTVALSFRYRQQFERTITKGLYQLVMTVVSVWLALWITLIMAWM